jgi:hypothetical protein
MENNDNLELKINKFDLLSQMNRERIQNKDSTNYLPEDFDEDFEIIKSLNKKSFLAYNPNKTKYEKFRDYFREKYYNINQSVKKYFR